MSWLFLILAGAAEVTWAISLKYAEGFTKLVPSIITIVGYAASLILLALALKKLPIGTTYAIWTGIGVIGTTVLGIFLFKEQLSVPQVICLVMILVGIIGLNLLGNK